MILKETILSAFNERGTLLEWLKTVEKLITERVLVKPVNNPQSSEIVAVDSTGEQVMLGVGTGLSINNGVINAVGGGSGGTSLGGGTQLYEHKIPIETVLMSPEMFNKGVYLVFVDSNSTPIDTSDITLISEMVKSRIYLYLGVSGIAEYEGDIFTQNSTITNFFYDGQSNSYYMAVQSLSNSVVGWISSPFTINEGITDTVTPL